MPRRRTVSVIVPVYNVEATLRRCVDSVLAQTYERLEIILVDDGSRDESLGICQRYGQSDGRITVLHHDNHGVSYTRNRGLERASGEYVMFIDADDSVSPCWIERYVAAIAESDADIVIGGLTEVRADGSSCVHKPHIHGALGTRIWKLLCESGDSIFGYVPNKIYRRSLIQDLRFDEHMTVQEDLSFAVDAYARASSIVAIDEAGYYYNYEMGKRQTPFLDLIANQIKIYEYAKPYVSTYDISTRHMSDLVIGWTYQYLFESELDESFYDRCEMARELQELSVFASVRTVNEKAFVYTLLSMGLNGMVLGWFRLRSVAKGLMRLRA